MKNYMRLTLGVLIAATCTPHVEAIQQDTAYFFTGLTGVTTFGLTGLLQYNKKITGGQAVFGYLASAAATAVAYYFLQSMRPQGRFNRARALLDEIRMYELAVESYHDKKIIERVKDLYVAHDYPLIDGFNDLTTMLEKVRDAQELLKLAKDEACSNYLLSRECESALQEAAKYARNVATAIRAVRTDAEFLQQQKMHKQELAAAQKLQIAQQNANAQDKIANAQAKMSSNTVHVHHR